MNDALIMKLTEINRLESEVIDELTVELLKHITAEEFNALPTYEKMQKVADWSKRE